MTRQPMWQPDLPRGEEPSLAALKTSWATTPAWVKCLLGLLLAVAILGLVF
jgi:hypothetical protein